MMKSKLLLRTNILLCTILTAGFAAVSLVDYSGTVERFRRDIEHVSELTAENIFHHLNSYVTKPVSVSMTMANDSLLKRLLAEENNRLDAAAYTHRIQEYLNAYREQYGYDSVFLVSAGTNRYYRFSGLDRELTRDNPENAWYFTFLDSPDEYTLDVDNDESQEAGRAVTTFVNCKIHGEGGRVLGVVGVGLRVGNMRELLQSYREEYGIRVMLIDDTGTAGISSESEGGDLTEDMFADFEYVNGDNIETVIAAIDAGADGARESFWVEGGRGDCFVTLRSVPAIQWRLILESDTSGITAQFMRQLLVGLGVTALIALAVLVVVNKVVMAYNNHLLQRVMAQEMEYNALVKQAAGEMYKDVHDEKERATRLIQDSQTDSLTGLCNRRFMEKRLGEIMSRLSRSRGALSVLMMDVDFFKDYNDAYGHGMGDECLRDVAAVLRDTVKRGGDFVARYGGEEFVAVLPDTDAEGARLVADALLRNMIARAIPHKRSRAAACVTLSIGGVTGRVEHAHTMNDYLKRADEALYASKANGRNRYTAERL